MIYGGNVELVCTRCSQPRKKHAISKMQEGTSTTGAVDAALAFFKNKKVTDFFMMGALVATFKDGTTLRLIATSGPNNRFGVSTFNAGAGGKANWEVANPTVPTDATKWTDIYKQRFTMPPHANLSQPCAAMKLLLGLGLHKTSQDKGYAYKSIELYEEVFKPTGLPVPENFREYHGQDNANTYAAQSCGPCNHRVPLLLCDGQFLGKV